MREWIIELGGRNPDLERLVGLRDGDAGWRIERDDRRGVVLRSSLLDALEDRSAVRREATKLIGFIDSAARRSVPRFGGVALADCVLILEGQEQFTGISGGNEAHMILPALTMKAYGAGVGPSPAPDGTPPSPREFEHWEILQLFELQVAHPDLADALRYLEEEPDLRGYYKAFEAIRDSVGGHAALLKTGWCSKRALSRFTQSAQPDRHHAWPEVEERMTEAEGRAFVRGLLDKLIKHLHRTGP